MIHIANGDVVGKNELFHTIKQAISDEQVHEAISGWEAYTSTNPRELEKWIAASKEELPFLKRAMQTHMSYFPSIQTGLNEVEKLAMDFIGDRSCTFTQFIAQERTNDGLSDLHFAAILNQLMSRLR
ncbi:hypothetical protein [Ammoniphilus sp. 3BR4]|uniref:hypothetical protein n=1 Tax=Ammoniphilus sp. 3BR4 TaxID=3158265 RepID=UPI003466F92D